VTLGHTHSQHLLASAAMLREAEATSALDRDGEYGTRLLEPASILLHIPCLPDLDLSANRRRSRHYMAQAQDTATERIRAQAMLREAGRELSCHLGLGHEDATGRLPGRVALHWTLHWPKGTRARDADGCADLLKPWIDAMKDLGWIQNDSPRHVPTVCYTSVPSSGEGPGMTLEIREAR